MWMCGKSFFVLTQRKPLRFQRLDLSSETHYYFVFNTHMAALDL